MSSRTAQPGAGVGLEVGNALNVNAQLVYNPAAYAGDLVNTVPFTADAGANVSINAYGATVGHQLANGQIAYWPSTVTSIGTDSFTLTILLRRDSQTSNGRPFSTYAAFGASGVLINMRDTSMSRYITFERAISGTLYRTTTTYQATTGAWYILTARRNAVTHKVNTFISLQSSYPVGESDEGSAPVTFEGPNVVLGGDTVSGPVYQPCTIGFIHLVKTALSDAQITSLQNNLWQVFEPETPSVDYLPGSFILAGNNTALRVGRRLAGSRGIFGMAGYASSGNEYGVNRYTDPMPLPCMMLYGVPAENVVDEPMPLPCLGLGATPASFGFDAVTGIFAVTGYPVITVGRELSLEAWWGEFAVAGAPATRDMDITANKAAFAETGVALTATQANTMTAAAGTFALAGYTSTGVPSVAGEYIMPAELGEFALIGKAVTMKQTGYAITAATGSFAVTGRDATLHGAQWAPIDLGPGGWSEVTDATTLWEDAA